MKRRMPHDGRKPILSKPSDLMRANRPYLFSDSQRLSAPRLERSLLEYHLETLVDRKEEYLFEDFCRRIAEAELCPNLKPQAGPLGGGDSKTDSSTYQFQRRYLSVAIGVHRSASNGTLGICIQLPENLDQQSPKRL